MIVIFAILLIVVFAICVIVIDGKTNGVARAAERFDAAERARRKAELTQAAITERDAFKAHRREQWAINECEFAGSPALIGLKKDFSAFSVVTYELGDAFRAGDPIEVPIVQLISAKVVQDDVRETYQRTQIVPVAITNKKSPVGRALVGGVLLGGAGVVMGAASGLGGKSTITNEERKVTDQRIVKGRPRLVVGTLSHGLMSIKFRADSHADHWLHQIQVARVNCSLPMLQ